MRAQPIKPGDRGAGLLMIAEGLQRQQHPVATGTWNQGRGAGIQAARDQKFGIDRNLRQLLARGEVEIGTKAGIVFGREPVEARRILVPPLRVVIFAMVIEGSGV